MELEPELRQQILAACKRIESRQKGGNQHPQFQSQHGPPTSNSKLHGAQPAALSQVNIHL